jgi:hypothetical protein
MEDIALETAVFSSSHASIDFSMLFSAFSWILAWMKLRRCQPGGEDLLLCCWFEALGRCVMFWKGYDPLAQKAFPDVPIITVPSAPAHHKWNIVVPYLRIINLVITS